MFYTGFTDDLKRRVYEHRNKVYDGFTSKYEITKLVYFEEFDDAQNALHREFLVKRYKRTWKTDMINKFNPHWDDLYPDLENHPMFSDF